MRIIRGKFGKRRFDPPKNIKARPTTDFAKENLFNVLENINDFDGEKACDLFAGTGAISLELLSRGCDEVVSVETATPQVNFMIDVRTKLNLEKEWKIVKGDVFKFIAGCDESFDFIFADPPYDHPRFEEIPSLIMESKMVKDGTLVVVEHSKQRNFTQIKGFMQHREYGSVNFTFIKKEQAASETVTEEND